MRKPLLTALCTSALLVPGIVFAQDDAAENPPENENEGAEVVDQKTGDEVKMTPSADGAKETAPGETHTVQKGDTLWDLSQRFLGSPWYWPKVWSYNPEIANPHWIYPGNLVRFFPAGEEVPSRVEVGEAPQEMDEGGGDVTSPEMMDESEERSVRGKATPYVPRAAIRVHRTAFVTRAEVEETGTLVATFSEKTMLSAPDQAYVKFKRPSEARIGDKYVVFHTEREVFHPDSGAKLGYVTRIDGLASVVRVEKNVATIQLSQTFEDVRLGQHIAPVGDKLNDALAPRANDREMKGMVVTTLEPQLTILGEHHYVVIDRGSGDGVQPGNTFTIVRNGAGEHKNPAKGQDMDLPTESIGLCVAVDVKERTCTCIVAKTIREVVIGDRVEMRVSTKTASVQ